MHAIDAQPDAPQWLIRDLWSAAAAGVIGGLPKSCKSWFGLDSPGGRRAAVQNRPASTPARQQFPSRRCPARTRTTPPRRPRPPRLAPAALIGPPADAPSGPFPRSAPGTHSERNAANHRNLRLRAPVPARGHHRSAIPTARQLLPYRDDSRLPDRGIPIYQIAGADTGETVTWQPLSRSDDQTEDSTHGAGDQAERGWLPRREGPS